MDASGTGGVFLASLESNKWCEAVSEVVWWLHHRSAGHQPPAEWECVLSSGASSCFHVPLLVPLEVGRAIEILGGLAFWILIFVLASY